MKKVKFIVEAGQVDSNGDIIKLDGLQVKDKTLLTKDFDISHPIGKCDVFKEDGVLKAEAELPEEMLNAYPAISFQILSSEPNKHGGRTIKEAKLMDVSLCQSPNADPNIKRIDEQLEG